MNKDMVKAVLWTIAAVVMTYVAIQTIFENDILGSPALPYRAADLAEYKLRI